LHGYDAQIANKKHILQFAFDVVDFNIEFVNLKRTKQQHNIMDN